MSSGDERLITALEAIYGAAAAPETWPQVLAAIAAVFDDIGANLTYFRDDGRNGAIVSPSLAAGVQEYNETWWQHDIRTMRGRERSVFVHQDVATDLDVVSQDEVHCHPFYVEFLGKFGLRWSATVAISPDPNIAVWMTVQRVATKPPFSERECATLLRLGRHCETSLRLGMRLMDSDLARAGLQETIARLGFGVFLLDSLGRVMFANDAAERLIGKGLERVGDRLAASVASQRPELDRAIAIATRGEPPTLAGEKPLLLQRPESGRALVAYLLPIRAGGDPAVRAFLSRARAFLLVVDTDARAPADPTLVRDVLGVTLGEAKVAALVGAGLPTREVSTKLGITEETVRTVLKRVFDKAHVSRQSELAALLNRIALGGASP